MWIPTHVQVTVHKGTGLLTKGKNNTNDCFVTIALGKTKYQTSVKEKASSQVEWHEECELPIPDQGNTAEIVLTAYHRNFLGVDEFLGRTVIPLNTLDFYERPKNRWYSLQSKPGKENTKERGQLEVKIAFNVKSGSLTDLSKKEKHKSSIGQLSSVVAHSVGGSLLSLGSADKRKGIKKFAKSIGSKMHIRSKKKDGDFDDGGSSIGSVGSLKIRSNFDKHSSSKQTRDDADPGVISEDEDEFTFDDLSHKSSASSLSQTASVHTPTSVNKNSKLDDTGKQGNGLSFGPAKPPRIDKPQPQQDEWESKLFGNKSKTLRPGSSESLNRKTFSSKITSQIEEEPDTTTSPSKPKIEEPVIKKTPEPATKKDEGMFSKLKNFRKDKNDEKIEKQLNSSERIIIGGENESPTVNNRISNELLQKFEGKTREDLILTLCDTQNDLEKHKKKLKELEDYLDELLLRVMETTPRILQNPYVNCKLAHKKLTS